MTHTPQTLVILGGGYAGVICANRVRSSLTPEEAARTRVILVNPTESFYERIRLHEVAAGSRETAARPLAELLHPQVELFVGTATRIDAAEHTVDLDTPRGRSRLPYTTLLYAVGSGSSAERTPGALEHAYAIAEPESARRAADALRRGEPGQRIVVVGGGFTGVETASEVAEQYPHASVTLLTAGPVVAPMRASARRTITRKLRRLGVAVQDGAQVASVSEGRLALADGSEVAFDVCLWTASFSIPRLAHDSGLAVDEIGRLRVDEHLRSVDSPDILGAGDAVRLPETNGAHLRMGCAVALPLGGAAAGTILAAWRGEDLPIASVGFLVQCLSIGRRDGYIQFVSADDSPRPLHLAGRAGASFKEMICRMTVDGPAKEATRPGAYWAPAGPRTHSEPATASGRV